MSGPGTPSGRPPKQMSSRLLTMKFMQRAAASTPLPPSPATQSKTEPPEPSAKRRKTSYSSSTPVTPVRDSALSETEVGALNAALAAEEAKRQEALERHARDTGETKWVFSSREDGNADSLREGLRVERVESGVEVNGWGGGQGRRLFGTFKKKPKRDPDSGSDDDEGSSEDSDEDESEDEEDASGMKALLREEGDRARTARKEKKKAEVAELKRLAEARRKKLVKPSRMTSISSGGGAKGGLPFRKEPRKEIKCYKCQRLGHMAKDCPNR